MASMPTSVTGYCKRSIDSKITYDLVSELWIPIKLKFVKIMADKFRLMLCITQPIDERFTYSLKF